MVLVAFSCTVGVAREAGRTEGRGRRGKGGRSRGDSTGGSEVRLVPVLVLVRLRVRMLVVWMEVVLVDDLLCCVFLLFYVYSFDVSVVGDVLVFIFAVTVLFLFTDVVFLLVGVVVELVLVSRRASTEVDDVVWSSQRFLKVARRPARRIRGRVGIDVGG